MAKPDQTLTRHDLEAKIVKHCWEDEAFREEFIADPAGTFVKHLKVPAASLPKIVIHEEEPGSWHIVLPAKPANTSELSEEELEKFAGASLSLFARVGSPASQVTISAIGSAVSGVTAAGAVVASVGVSVAQTVGW